MNIAREKNPVSSGGKSVLLMEDDDMVRKITAGMLQYLGYSVETAIRGEDVMTLYRLRNEEGRTFDAVILDIYQLDGIGGEETLRRLREYHSGVKAIVSSSSVGHKMMVNHRTYGFLASLPKPYDMAQLGQVLQDVIAPKRQGKIEER